MKFSVADAHLDLAYDVVRKRAKGSHSVLENEYAPIMLPAGLSLVISSIYLENEEAEYGALEAGLEQLNALLEDIEESPSFFLITNKETLESLNEEKVGIVVSFEGAEPIGTNLQMLAVFRRLGLRGAGLVWSRRNAIGTGSELEGKVPLNEPGLTPFGYEFLAAAKDCELFIDVAHLNDQGFWDVISRHTGTVMLSHGGCRQLNPIARNNSDSQLQAVISSDGFIGINALNFILSDGVNISENHIGYIEHLKHVIALGGEKNLGFGFDFNDQILPYVSKRRLDAMIRKPSDCIKGYQEMPQLLHLMTEKGFSDGQILDISSQNLIRFLRKVLPDK